MLLFEIVMSPRPLKMPPPSAKRASSESPEALPMRLSLTVVFARVRLPEVSMPPPNAHATGQPPHGANGTVSFGATRLPVMTLLLIVSVAPPPKSLHAPPLKSVLGGTSMPPPAAQTPAFPVHGTDSGLERVAPPVIVTPLIETVGSLAAKIWPIVMTGPPPLMIVLPAPAPIRLALTSTVKPPA